MSKVFGMHMIALKPGVKAEDFEEFVTEEVYPLPWPYEVYLLKGDRGDREGKYLWGFEFESVEARDRFTPSPGKSSEEMEQFWESDTWLEFARKWDTFATAVAAIYTDYVVVGK
jgi:hypothetical protein